jgi:hypothetical protein
MMNEKIFMGKKEPRETAVQVVAGMFADIARFFLENEQQEASETVSEEPEEPLTERQKDRLKNIQEVFDMAKKDECLQFELKRRKALKDKEDLWELLLNNKETLKDLLSNKCLIIKFPRNENKE